jgi:hypothetical protein
MKRTNKLDIENMKNYVKRINYHIEPLLGFAK